MVAAACAACKPEPTWVSDVAPVGQNPAANVQLDNRCVEHKQQDQTSDGNQPSAAHAVTKGAIRTCHSRQATMCL
jgi:hypothetical protein